MTSREIFVSISLGTQTFPVGRLWCHTRGNKDSASFEYDRKWLQRPESFALGPVLQLTPGTFHTEAHQALFGAAGDSAPDRWGRALMRRAENERARQQKQTPRTLSEADYLLGVNDHTRQGALRFATQPNGPFLDDSARNTVPPLIELPKLLTATEHYLQHNENAEELALLLAPGSSLGGARPKASVQDQNGNLAIAKFPRHDDDINIVAWEAVALTLAKKAGINTPSWRLETILDKPVLIVQRFDRHNEQRLPFLSAMSLLNAQDREQRSYLEIAYALARYSHQPNIDLAELWRRIVFSIYIANTDDHLRNHGCLYHPKKGWQLSPVYDINPTPLDIKPRVLSTCIDFDNNNGSIDIALSTIDEFRIPLKQAKIIVQEVADAVHQWQHVARQFGLKKQELDRMASAFLP